MVLEGSDLDRPPGDLLDHTSMFVHANDNYVTDLKRSICLKGNACEKVTQCILQRKTKNNAKDSGGRE